MAYGVQGSLGLWGAMLGAALAAVMCGTSGGILRWASKARGNAIVAGMLASVTASFLLMGLGILLLNLYWRPGLESATLTALAIYLGYRYVEAFRFASFARVTQPTGGGGSA